MSSNTGRQVANRIAQLRAIRVSRRQDPPEPARQPFGLTPRKAKPARRRGRK